MRVRPATPEDLGAAAELLDLLDAEQAEWRVFSPRPGYREDILARYRAALDDSEALLSVAEEEDGVIVGMALVRPTTPSSFSDQRAMELSTVVVRPSHRRRGVGRTLTEAAVRFAADRGVGRITLKVFSGNRGAVQFWEAVGFRSRFVQYTASTEDVLRRVEEGTELPS